MRPLLSAIAILFGLFASFIEGRCDERPKSARPPKDEADLRRWLENMAWHHRFTLEEMREATGLSVDSLKETLSRLSISSESRPRRDDNSPLLLLPYPGGRHPRTGFRDGAIEPQRETKLSAFLPWDDSAYVVIDVPEAIWNEAEGRRELLYLAHTHVPTMWTRQGIALEPLEWREEQGALVVERRLPNNVSFGARAVAKKRVVELELWLTNGSEQTLRGLRVQNCVMLAGSREFSQQTNDNKTFDSPFAECRSSAGDRWVIAGWQRCARAWGNPPCPCLHSDPEFPECAPGQTHRLRGVVAFYEGKDLPGELERLRPLLAE